MYSLQSIYRLMLGVWLILVFGLGVYLNTHVGKDLKGSLYDHYFAQSKVPPPLPVDIKSVEPLPEPKPPIIEQVKEPTPLWQKLNRGKAGGLGELLKPEFQVLNDTAFEVQFTLSDRPGEYRFFYPTNVDSVSVDLMGSWGTGLQVDKWVEKGLVKRVQIAKHKDWVRISAIARDVKDKLIPSVEYAEKVKKLRIVFTKDKP